MVFGSFHQLGSKKLLQFLHLPAELALPSQITLRSQRDRASLRNPAECAKALNRESAGGFKLGHI